MANITSNTHVKKANSSLVHRGPQRIRKSHVNPERRHNGESREAEDTDPHFLLLVQRNTSINQCGGSLEHQLLLVLCEFDPLSLTHRQHQTRLSPLCSALSTCVWCVLHD